MVDVRGVGGSPTRSKETPEPYTKGKGTLRERVRKPNLLRGKWNVYIGSQILRSR